MHADFRGTITYASQNAHLKKDLSRRDDLWSFYFVILEFLTDNLPWRHIQHKDDVKEIKIQCLKNPSEHLWNHPTIKDIKQLKDIFIHIQNLKYDTEPNYQLIRMLLLEIRNNYLRNQYPTINQYQVRLNFDYNKQVAAADLGYQNSILVDHVAGAGLEDPIGTRKKHQGDKQQPGNTRDRQMKQMAETDKTVRIQKHKTVDKIYSGINCSATSPKLKVMSDI